MLGAGFDRDGEELALATMIAGGTYLAVEPDAQRLKTALRHGACDFLVNTLDEALRVLKNEIRKHTPLSVGLLGAADEIQPAMTERGVQPDILSGIEAAKSSPAAQAGGVFLNRGAQLFPADAADIAESPAADEVIWTAATPRELRRLDAAALETLSARDTMQRQWLERAGAYFDRQSPRERVFRASPAGRETLLQAFRQAGAAELFSSRTTLRWRGEDSALQTAQL